MKNGNFEELREEDRENRPDRACWEDDDPAMEAFLEIVRRHLETPKTWVVNGKRAAEIRRAYNALRHMALSLDPDAEIEWGRGELDLGDVWIRVETDVFEVQDMKRFVEVLKLADAFEAYPLTNGKIRISLTFDGFMLRL